MSEIRKVKSGIMEPSFTLGNRVRRAIWNLCYAIFFRLSPRPLHGWRSAWLRLFGAKVGRSVHVYGKARIWAPWNLVLEDFAAVGDDANLYSMATITIRAHAIVSQGAHLCAGTHDYEDPAFQLYSLPITIGERAWVCTEAFIGPGVEIGAGAVIGARSVVTKNMPEWMVCAGSPCKPLKPRVMRES
jgi:putative colanic acid biosynthesis acetyltransferase WcaF